MKQATETEILFDDCVLIEKQMGEGYLKNASIMNSDCTNNIYLPQEDECITA